MEFGSSFVLDRQSDSEDEVLVDEGAKLAYSDDDTAGDLFFSSAPAPPHGDLDDLPPNTHNHAPVLRERNSRQRRVLLDSDSSSSASSSDSDDDARRQNHHPTSESSAAAPKVRRVQKASTNVVSIQLGTLSEEAFMMTGDPEQCTCGAYFSVCSFSLPETEQSPSSSSSTSTSKVNPLKIWKQGQPYAWHCEFCGALRDIHLEEEELPRAPTVDYVLASPTSSAASPPQSFDTNFVIFLVDTSGSMCVSSPLQGDLKLKGASLCAKDPSSFLLQGDATEQFLPNEARGVTYVSRLQCAKAAIAAQLQRLALEAPERRVVLISFSSEITVHTEHGATVLAGDRLSRYDDLYSTGSAMAAQLSQGVGQGLARLQETLFSLSEEGPTALGPALVCAAGIASTAVGSRIIVCTDGLANVGLGSLEEGEGEAAAGFYADLGVKASQFGASVSVVTIKGTDCKLENLGAMAEATGGSVNIVDPVNLTREFASILEAEVLAVQTQVKVLLSRQLHFKGHPAGTICATPNQLTIDVGPVTSTSHVSFNFGVNHNGLQKQSALLNNTSTMNSPHATSVSASSIPVSDDLPDLPASPILGEERPSEVPFQVQISFVDARTQVKKLRIISQMKPLTADRDQAETAANMSLLAARIASNVASMASEGDYSASRFQAFSDTAFLKKLAAKQNNEKSNRAYKMLKKNAKQFEREVHRQQRKERKEGRNLSEEEADEDMGGLFDDANDNEPAPVLAAAAPAARKSALSKKKSARANLRSDKAANVLYRFKQANSSLFD